jgi:hypothetical protein
VTEERSPAEVLEEVAPHTVRAIEAPRDEKLGRLILRHTHTGKLPQRKEIFGREVATSSQVVSEQTSNDAREAARELLENLRQKKEVQQGRRRLTSFSEMTQPEEKPSFAEVLADMRKYLNSGSDVCRQTAIDWASDPANGCELVRVNGRVR